MEKWDAQEHCIDGNKEDAADDVKTSAASFL